MEEINLSKHNLASATSINKFVLSNSLQYWCKPFINIDKYNNCTLIIDKDSVHGLSITKILESNKDDMLIELEGYLIATFTHHLDEKSIYTTFHNMYKSVYMYGRCDQQQEIKVALGLL